MILTKDRPDRRAPQATLATALRSGSILATTIIVTILYSVLTVPQAQASDQTTGVTQMSLTQGRQATRIRDFPRDIQPIMVGSAVRGGIKITAGRRNTHRRAFFVDRALVVDGTVGPWMVVGRKRQTTSSGYAVVRLVANAEGKWAFRIRVPRTRTASKAISHPLVVTATRRLDEPRELSWADDSRTLTYQSGPWTRPTLAVLGADGVTKSVFTTSVPGVIPNGHSGPPSVSPNGDVVAFWSDATNLVPESDNNHEADLFVKNVASGEVRRVNTGPWGTSPGGSSTQLDQRIAFSPDGTKLAFDVNKQLYVHDIENKETADLTTGTGCSIGVIDFSRDGEAILVHVSQGPGAPDLKNHIATVDADTGVFEYMTTSDNGEPLAPKYNWVFGGLPNDETLVGWTWSNLGDQDVYRVVDLRTHSIIRTLPANGWDPTLSPSGRFLAQTVYRGGRSEAVSVTDVITGSRREVPWTRIFQETFVRLVQPESVNHLAAVNEHINLGWNTTKLILVNASTGAGHTIRGVSDAAFSLDGLVAVVRNHEVVVLRNQLP